MCLIEVTNNVTLNQCVMGSLKLLWPTDTPYDRLLLFVLDAVSYMGKFRQT